MIQNVFHNYTVSVIKETKNLAEFVSGVMNDKNLTARDVETRSGFHITHSYVNKIKNGDAKNPSSPKLQALAKGLGEPEEVIFAIVRGKKANLEKISNERFAHIANGYAALSQNERESLEPLLTAIEITISRAAALFETKSGKPGIRVMTLDQVKEDDEKKRGGKKKSPKKK